MLEPDIAGLTLRQPPATHMSDAAPALLNVLCVCDVPKTLGMLAPRTVTLIGAEVEFGTKAAAIYRAAGVSEKLVLRK
jgi:hypothetical protein